MSKSIYIWKPDYYVDPKHIALLNADAEGGGGGLTVVRTDVQLCSAIRINLRYKSKDTEI